MTGIRAGPLGFLFCLLLLLAVELSAALDNDNGLSAGVDKLESGRLASDMPSNGLPEDLPRSDRPKEVARSTTPSSHRLDNDNSLSDGLDKLESGKLASDMPSNGLPEDLPSSDRHKDVAQSTATYRRLPKTRKDSLRWEFGRQSGSNVPEHFRSKREGLYVCNLCNDPWYSYESAVRRPSLVFIRSSLLCRAHQTHRVSRPCLLTSRVARQNIIERNMILTNGKGGDLRSIHRNDAFIQSLLLCVLCCRARL
jgi:hypothetical protein